MGFRILYALYDKYAKGNRAWYETLVLSNDEDLRYISKNSIIGDIDYLVEKGFINGTSYPGESPNKLVKINNNGIDIIRSILKNYPLYLKSLDDGQSKREYNHISAIRDEIGRRSQTYAYIRERVSLFEQFLELTDSINVTRHAIPQIVPKVETNRENEEIVTRIIESLYTLNQLFQKRFGTKIFKDNSFVLDGLRKKGNDRDWFTSLLSKLATIMDRIYFDEIKGQIGPTIETKSINLLEQFFKEKKLNCDDPLHRLRRLHGLRSRMPPTHNDEQGAIMILQHLNIPYPVENWLTAGRICLKEFLESINKLVVIIQ